MLDRALFFFGALLTFLGAVLAWEVFTGHSNQAAMGSLMPLLTGLGLLVVGVMRYRGR